MQHLSSINLCVRIASAELVWIHYPEGSVEYIPHLSKEITMKEKAKEEVDRQNSKIKSWEMQWNQELSCRGKRRGNIPRECAGGSAQGKGSPAAAARGEWAKHK